MGKTGKWIKSFLTGGKKDQHREKERTNNNGSNHSSSVTEKPAATPVVIQSPTPKEKKRWSFRRPSAATSPASKDSITDSNPSRQTADLEPVRNQKIQALAVATATAAAAAADAAQAAAGLISLTPTGNSSEKRRAEEDVAAVKIQSTYRSYLARKALRALRGLVKLQALVRGHLVRKQATATLRCMQALVTAQARARAQRILQSAEDGKQFNHRRSPHRRINQDVKYRHSNQEMEKGMEENIKIVEMDIGQFKNSSKARNGYSNYQHNDRTDNRFPPNYPPQYDHLIPDYQKVSPAPSAITDISPRTCSGHFEDFAFATAQSSPHCWSAMSRPDPSRTPLAFPHPENGESFSYDHPLYPNYMANTQSSRAKARSQSAPKQRPDSFERQPSRRRPSVEGRNIPRAMRMQRSSSHVGATAQNYQYPWAIKLDKSTVSLMESECGSTCSALTNANYCRSVVSYDPQGNRY